MAVSCLCGYWLLKPVMSENRNGSFEKTALGFLSAIIFVGWQIKPYTPCILSIVVIAAIIVVRLNKDWLNFGRAFCATFIIFTPLIILWHFSHPALYLIPDLPVNPLLPAAPLTAMLGMVLLRSEKNPEAQGVSGKVNDFLDVNSDNFCARYLPMLKVLRGKDMAASEEATINKFKSALSEIARLKEMLGCSLRHFPKINFSILKAF